MPSILRTDPAIQQLLQNTRTIAIVGASPRPHRPSYGVMAALKRAGFIVIPVNPAAAGQEILGERTLAGLGEATVPIDMVDVFRRAEETPEIAREAVKIGAKSLWLQLDIVSNQAAEIALAGGLDVVMDRCTAIEVHRLLGR